VIPAELSKKAVVLLSNIYRESISRKKSNQGLPDRNIALSTSTTDEKSSIYQEAIGDTDSQTIISFSKENILNGIIFSEILGKPRCKR
jgi:hypothetical protein